MSTSPAMSCIHLQSRVDEHFFDKLQNKHRRIAEINGEIRGVLEEVKKACNGFLLNPHSPDHCDLSALEEQIDDLERIYQKYKGEFLDQSSENSRPQSLFPPDRTHLTKENLQHIVDTIDQIRGSYKDEVQEITQSLYLTGQLHITIIEIVRRMVDTQSRSAEKMVDRMGAR